jgi:energy-coupling factor transport system ATP-binding protein
MENRGMDSLTMKKRMAETVGFFGIEEWLHKPTHTLSGGQKQLTALCAAMMCKPALLLLDEPISQLDPLSGAAFLEMLVKINDERGVTIIMTEHRMDDCVALSNKIAFMHHGQMVFSGSAADTVRFLYENGQKHFVPQLPSASLHIDGEIILSQGAFKERYQKPLNVRPDTGLLKNTPAGKPVLRLCDITFHYPGHHLPVLRQLNLTLFEGECLCIVGGNGSGKSTLLKLIAGIIKPSEGRIKTKIKQIGYMPQHIRDYFIHDRVGDEIVNLESPHTQSLITRFGVGHLMDRHPFDISGGEQQKCVLLAILSRKPELILLDEPTKGMDTSAKRKMSGWLRKSGAAVIIATHDLEYAARYADRCVMLFDGEIVYEGEPRAFFTGNDHYTTPLHKAARHLNPLVMLQEDVPGFIYG